MDRLRLAVVTYSSVLHLITAMVEPTLALLLSGQPGPGYYDVPGFTDELLRKVAKRPAVKPA